MKKKNYIAPLMEQTACVMMKFAVCSGGGPDSPEQQGGNEAPGLNAPKRKVF